MSTETKRKPSPQDYEKAKAQNPNWEELTTRKKNSLALNEMYVREYSELCDAIKDFRK